MQKDRATEIIISLKDLGERYAVSGALDFARQHEELFKKHCGVHGWECLLKLFEGGGNDEVAR